MLPSRKTALAITILAAITALALWIDVPQHPSLKIGSVYRDLNIKLGLDLQVGSHLVYRAAMEGISDEDAS